MVEGFECQNKEQGCLRQDLNQAPFRKIRIRERKSGGKERDETLNSSGNRGQETK